MSYKITAGIDEAELPEWLEKAFKKYGLYEGRAVNYTHADVAPIVMCTVVCGDEMLLVKRGFGLADAEGYWSTVNGYIDEIKPIRAIAQQEVSEELGLTVASDDIKVAQSYTLDNPKEKRRYIVFACLIRVQSKPEIVLDHEHTDFAWIPRERLDTYDTLDDLPYAIDTALRLK